jgi:hypothetical protein
MKPAWDKLAEHFVDSSSVLIADVDCDGAGASVCDAQKVEGYPTIMAYKPGAKEGEEYELGRKYAELLRYVEDNLEPPCDLGDNKGNCSPVQLEELAALSKLGAAELEAQIGEVGAALAKATADLDDLVRSLQAQHEEAEKAKEALQARLSPKFRMLHGVKRATGA